MAKVYVIYGSPLSGKTTYVDKHKGDNDLIYDYDKIMSVLSGKPSHIHNNSLLPYVMDIRDLIIDKVRYEKNIENVWIITTRVSEDLKKRLSSLNPNYKEIKISREQAHDRLLLQGGDRDVSLWQRLIDEYFDEETREDKLWEFEQSKFYRSSQWQHLRDRYRQSVDIQCDRCEPMCYNKDDEAFVRRKRTGNDIRFGIVHHKIHLTKENIWESSISLEWDNLELLCISCHNKEHYKPKKKRVKEVREDVKFDDKGRIIINFE